MLGRGRGCVLSRVFVGSLTPPAVEARLVAWGLIYAPRGRLLPPRRHGRRSLVGWVVAVAFESLEFIFLNAPSSAMRIPSRAQQILVCCRKKSSLVKSVAINGGGGCGGCGGPADSHEHPSSIIHHPPCIDGLN
jgi:hypothetical protein